ncbi:hypothetical protein HS088_TW04G01472 [Tripterygium wilfordii]|uniref:Uncharacterized protein n=2 Tax=Tripterygium wilfordii TaxID=458696 RepID=A0A7J7DT75_TRIWF|nr:hypothetical protein HS088_TW04G01472 [Tripterygium wilfordii]
MKKMKGVALAPRNTSPSPYGVYEDPISFKHQSLLQDYEELYKETEVRKNNLEMMKQKRLTLLAEVRFLRQRYKLLMQNQTQKSILEQQRPARNSEIKSRNIAKKSSRSGKNSALPPPVPPFDLNKKGKTYIERQATLKKPSSSFDLSQKHMSYGAAEASLQDSRSILDLNERERIESGKEATVRNATPVFDLNQNLIEEEELQGNRESSRTEELKKSSIRAGSDEQYNDMMLSACRNIGNGPNKSGKRKISWQDQLALRV